MHRPSLLSLTIGLSMLAVSSTIVPASAQKPTKTPAGAKLTTTPTKPVKTSGPVVLGTTQLPGDFGKFGTTYTVGTREPINFTLKSADYTVEPLSIGNNTWVPKADEKLLVLHYTIHNPIAQEQGYYWGSLRFTAVDAKDVNHEFITAVVREGERQPLSITLKPAQKIDVVAAILVPADGVVPKLIVEREKGAPVIRYDLHGKVSALTAPFADATDTTGATAVKNIPMSAGAFVPLGVFDARLDAVSYANQPILNREPGKGNRFVSAVFTLKNRTTTTQSYYWGSFNAELRDADGEKVKYTQALLKANRNETTSGDLAPGEEARVRFFFAVPENVPGKTVSLAEGKQIDVRVARTVVFDLTSASNALAE